LRSVLLCGAAAMLALVAGCGYGSSSKSSTKTASSNPNPLSKLKFRAFVANDFQKVLHIIDETRDQIYSVTNSTTGLFAPANIPITESSIGFATSPTMLAPAGTLTLVATHDTFGGR